MDNVIIYTVLGKSHDYVQHANAERATVIKHADNLKVEGKMEGRSLNQTFVLDRADKAKVMKHEDNLRLEGSMSMSRKDDASMKGERYGIVKREDNLKVEGAFEGRVKEASTSRRLSSASTASRRSDTRERSNIIIGDDASVASTSKVTVASRTVNSAAVSASSSTAVNASSSTAANASSSTSTSLAQSSSSVAAARSNVSSAVAGALVQSGKASAGITAVNKDTFASSLRESSATAVVQQKEISVIEHHRKQSLQKQRNELSVSGGYDLSAHTGRTAAYGGRDYEYSNTLSGRRSEARTETYTKAAGFSTQEYGNRSQEYGTRSQEYGSKSRSEARAETSMKVGVLSGQEYGSRSSGFRQQQQQQYSAASAALRQETSSSATYQSTSQQSYRAQAQVYIYVSKYY